MAGLDYTGVLDQISSNLAGSLAAQLSDAPGLWGRNRQVPDAPNLWGRYLPYDGQASLGLQGLRLELPDPAEALAQITRGARAANQSRYAPLTPPNGLKPLTPGEVLTIPGYVESAAPNMPNPVADNGRLTPDGLMKPFEGDYPTSEVYGTAGPLWSTGKHRGVDFATPHGTALQAIDDGEVIAVGYDGTFGRRVIVRHAWGDSLLAHLSGTTVKVGDRVTKGGLLGYSGGTPGSDGAGTSTGAHTHLETHVDGAPVDPYSLGIQQRWQTLTQE